MKKKNGFLSVLGAKLIWLSFFVLLTAAFIGTVSYEATKAAVQVTYDGESELIRTHSNTVEDLLSELDVTVQPQDELSHKQSAPITYGMDVHYIPSKTIKLAINEDTKKKIETTASTVGEFLKEHELKVKKHDELSHERTTPIEDGLKIEVDRAFQVTFNNGGEKQKVWTTASTVEDFLKEHDVSLNPLDQLKPAKNQQLSAETPVILTRVEKVTDVVEEEVDFTVETRTDSSLAEGKERVVSSGEKGIVTKKYQVILKNGKESSRKLIDETVKKESQKKIVAVGTKVATPSPSPSSVSTAASASNDSGGGSSSEATTVSRGDTSGARTLYMHATAYTANCAGCSGITATGINLKANPGMKVIAVDPNVIPLGTRVWVEGYGYAVAGDTGGAINGNRIDLFVPSKSEALSFGRRNVQVKILD